MSSINRFNQTDATERRFRYERYRLHSLNNWRSGTVSKLDLSMLGFYLSEYDNTIKCYFCDLEYEDFPSNVDIGVEHFRRNQFCPLMSKSSTDNIPMNRHRLLRRLHLTTERAANRSRNGALSLVLEALRRQPDDFNNLSDIIFGGNIDALPTALFNSHHERPIVEKTVLSPLYPKYTLESARLKTFEYFPKGLNISIDRLAKAGLFYTQKGDITTCYVSGCEIKDFAIGANPFECHANNYEACDYIRLMKDSKIFKEIPNKKRKMNAFEEPNGSDDSSNYIGISSSKEIESSDQTENNAKAECLICFDSEREALLLPCHHLISCLRCSVSLKECAICRISVTDIKRIYLA